MKNIILYLAIASALMSCQAWEDRQEQKKYDLALQEELKSGVRNDDIFLGYRLGMSEEEYYEHSKKMYKSGKIKYGGLYLEYKMRLSEYSNDSAIVEWYPSFHENKLYKIEAMVNSTEEYTTSGYVQISLMITLLEAYQNMYKLPSEYYEGQYTYKWIQGNRHIELSQSKYNHCKIIFTDLYAKR